MKFTKKILLAVLVFSIILPTLAHASFDTSLKYGSSGSAVITLQSFLQTEGFLTGKADGKFGPGTKKAVIAFQAANGLTADGSFGPASRAKANSLVTGLPTTSGTTGTSTSTSTSTTITPTTPVVIAPLSGTLDLAVASSYTSPTVMPPQSNIKLADFTLTNNTTEAVNLSKVEIDLLVNSDANIATSYVKNLYVTYGSSQTTSLNAISPQNYFWPTNFQLAVGKSVDLSVYGDINSTIPLTSVLNTNLLVSGVSAVSATKVFTNQDAILSGQNTTFNTSSLSVGVDSTSPAAQIVMYNQRVVAGVFQFTGTADSYTVSQLGFVIPNLINSGAISDVVLKDTATKATLATVFVKNNVSGNSFGFNFLNINIPVPLNLSKSVTVYYDLNKNINSNSTNIDISPVLGYVRATNSKGISVDGAASSYSGFFSSYGGVTLPAGGVTVSSLVMFKTVPTVASIPITNTKTSDGSSVNLYSFSVAANQSGDVSVKQLTFDINLTDTNNTNLSLNNFSFMKGSVDDTGSVAIGTIDSNNNFIALAGTNNISSGGTSHVVVSFLTDEIIPAGKTETYTLKAQVFGLTSSTLGADSISTSLSSDGSVSGGSSLQTVFSKFYFGLTNASSPAITYYNFLWSDMSESFPNMHDDFNGDYTNDWYTGSGVIGLPLGAETVSAK